MSDNLFPLLRIRYFDLIILIPNVIFLLFIIIKWIRTRTKLNTNKPLLLSVTCLLLLIALTNILRCAFVMIFPDQAFHAQETIVKVIERFSRFVSNPMLFRFFGYRFNRHFHGQN